MDDTTLSLPDGLNAAVCLPGSNYSHYGPAGGCSDYAECELGTAKCRSFDADNVELHLPQSDEVLSAPAPGETRPTASASAQDVITVRYNAASVGRAEVTVFERGPRLGPFH